MLYIDTNLGIVNIAIISNLTLQSWKQTSELWHTFAMTGGKISV